MQPDSESDTLSSLLSILNDNQPGSSATYTTDAASVELMSKLLSREDYVSIAGQLTHDSESDAKNLLDFMLHLLRDGCLSNLDPTMDINRRARRLMFKIVSTMPVMPSSLFVTGVSIPVDREYIGGGGFGHIFKGQLQGKVVALKLLYKPDHDVDFCREALMWRSLNHNLILPFLGIHKDDLTSQFFLVSPYMKNGTLAQWRKTSNPSIVDVEKRMLQVALGIEYIHSEGVVHGDLRGANILLDAELHVKIADFGLTRLSEATNTRSGALHLNFAAPELFGFTENTSDDSDDVPIRTQMSDVYAFGCLYYEIHFNRIPFSGKKDIQIWTLISRGALPSRLDEPPLSDDAWDVIQRCWARNPSERPNLKDVVAEVKAISLPTTIARDLLSLSLSLKKTITPDTSVRGSSPPAFSAIGSPSLVSSASLGSYVRGGGREEIARAIARAEEEYEFLAKRAREYGHEAGRERGSDDITDVHVPLSASAVLPSTGVTPPSQDVMIAFPDDIHNVPAEFKRKGPGWSAVFNPKVKKVLDVELMHNLMHEGIVRCVRFSADGKYLATCNRTAQIYDTKTGAKTCVLTDESLGDLIYIQSVCFSPDGKFLATGAEDGQIKIWDIGKKSIFRVLKGHRQGIYSLNFFLNGHLVISGSGDKTVRVWDIADPVAPSRVLAINDPDLLNNDKIVTSVATSPSGQFVAAGSLDSVVWIWDVSTGVLVERLQGHRDSVYSVAFTPDGKGLVSGSLDKTVKLWDVTGLTGSNSKREDLFTGGHGAADLETPEQSSVMRWDGEKGSPCIANFTGHKDCVLSIAVSPDSQWIVSGSKDRGVLFWDAGSAEVQCLLSGHKSSVVSIDLSPMGGLLATGSGDWQAKIWSYRPTQV